MINELFTVYVREKEQVGIGEFGDVRTFIRASEGVLIENKLIQLHELGPHIAALNRDGFSHLTNGAFYNEQACTFARRNSDFKDKNYAVFVQVRGDVQAAVARIDDIGIRGLTGEQRKHFNEWLRVLDMSCSYLVAYPDDPATVLVLCEYAREKSLVIFASVPGIPATSPSADKQRWVEWLCNFFDKAKVLDTYACLWPTPAFNQPAHDVIGDPSDILSYIF